MKNLQFQLTLDIDLELQDTEDEKDVKKRITAAIEDHFYERLLHQDDNGSLKIRTSDPTKKTIQTQAERFDSLVNVTAYFSSDGPAFVAEIQHPLDSLEKLTHFVFLEINAALREAHHKYIIKLHED